MTPKLTLYSRKDCCLCEDMKNAIRQAAEIVPVTLEEVDVDGSPELQVKYGDQVPVLFIDGKKAFKYRVTERELLKRLGRGALSKLRSLVRGS
jgi:glutaredoxin